jgi:hypothetical protein
MKKRDIPRHVDNFKMFFLDIYGIAFMIFPIIFDIMFIAKFSHVSVILVGFVTTVTTTISFLLVAEFPNKRERGIDIFSDFLKYQILGDRELYNNDLYKEETQNPFNEKENLNYD